MNPMKLLKLKSAWECFQSNHPKFTPFLQAVSQNALTEGSIIEFTVTNAEGKAYHSNIKLMAADMELVKEIKDTFN